MRKPGGKELVFNQEVNKNVLYLPNYLLNNIAKNFDLL